ncbi:MAG: molybdopterin converting factor subunit 1 [Ignavibacteriales bacterium]|nr:molybdopterin converting factor subunit 1 [Ignavibacteriales bacterium]
MNINIKFFAAAKEVAGKEEMQFSLPSSSTASSLLDLLVEQFPGLQEWKQYVRVAVNQEYVSLDYALNENDEVAIIPPVSGG